MMSLFKRGNIWWTRFTTPNGERIRESTGTDDRKQAQEYHDRLKAKYWEVQKLGEKPEHSWQDAVMLWLDETSHKASQHDDIHHLRWLDPYFGALSLNNITRDRIDQLITQHKSEGVSNATVNRTLAVIRAILRRASLDWEWIDKIPRIKLLPEPKRRIRWITREEAAALIEDLPEHLAEMVRFSLATGLRQANVTHLEWSQVDLERRVAWIHADQAKAREAISVPLNAEAVLVLRRQLGKNQTRVFTYQGKPVIDVNTKAWRHALKRVGIEFRWHDLRHTWASWHVQNGTPLHVLQELGGLGVGGNGTALCAPGAKSSGELCRKFVSASSSP
ncbi:tyrosine-type recombinase/integrase [Methylomonas sp. 2BW1-5-20]|uniref:tyrosine-type recombinase/integrase n=1 Tax=Methylomonas sp. 2BW1-5-20 TaxID=3376686 RepID=UPI00404DC3CE